ncbi:hypothetical protein PUATCC27989T_03856 [Phytobacter ursingii]|uniref:EAL domain-containing protein n=1 Tax=Phytobacter ursingii TaxID=1972431 RepID=A0AB35RKE6_9ENTR|nr:MULTISPECIES: hypothetical protein [Enterobacteriaceae]MDV2860905.1 hypothetical protein [Phytobacter ursingii]GJL34747.1 diguanylate phosphodiesterase [Enterobacter hormaechei]VTP15937.1 hypothetical protein PUATCC27989T_03856 [Phytobacter ursingii]
MPYLAERITTPHGQLLGVKIYPRKAPVLNSVEKKRTYLFDLMNAIGNKADFFKKRGLFCLVSITDEEIAMLLTFDLVLQATLARLPFVKLQINQTFETAIGDLAKSKNGIWLSHVGNKDAPFIQYCEAIILDETFTSNELSKNTFPYLIQNLKRYCEKIIIKIDNDINRRALEEAGIWACCGLYAPTPFSKVHQLM